MGKVVLFISMSLDGYLAKSDGNIDWLHSHQKQTVEDKTYEEFYSKVDTVILGRNIYDQIVNVLAKDKYPYADSESYVITSRPLEDRENIKFTSESVSDLVKKLKEEKEYIWIVGGSRLIQPLLEENLIDEYQIAIIPTLLGDGIKLFRNFDNLIELQLKESKAINGITYLTYTR